MSGKIDYHCTHIYIHTLFRIPEPQIRSSVSRVLELEENSSSVAGIWCSEFLSSVNEKAREERGGVRALHTISEREASLEYHLLCNS